MHAHFPLDQQSSVQKNENYKRHNFPYKRTINVEGHFIPHKPQGCSSCLFLNTAQQNFQLSEINSIFQKAFIKIIMLNIQYKRGTNQSEYLMGSGTCFIQSSFSNLPLSWSTKPNESDEVEKDKKYDTSFVSSKFSSTPSHTVRRSLR